MKFETFEYTTCPYCGDALSLESPPANEQYEMGEVRIKDGSILLPKSNSVAARSKYIEGYYCNVECLINYLYESLGLPTRTVESKPKLAKPLSPKEALKKWLKPKSAEESIVSQKIPEPCEFWDEDEDTPF